MKCCGLRLRDVLALGIALVALLGGLVMMFNAEGSVFLQNAAADPAAIHTEFYAHVLPGIRQYSLAIGGILLAISVAYILLGAEEDISTELDEKQLKK